jgi:hypothetical protein
MSAMLPPVAFGGQGGYTGEANNRTIINMLIWRARYTICAAAALLAVGGTGAALALGTPAGSSHIRADAKYCGLVSCAALHSARHPGARSRAQAPGDPAEARRSGATVPPTSATPMRLASSPAPARAPTLAPAGHVPRPRAEPTPSATPATAAVTVSYSAVQRWGGGFQGEFIIANHGSSGVAGWQIVITLSGDRVDTVWNADWEYGSGGSVVMTAAPYDQVIEPGAAQSVNFVAQGGTTAPTSCTFDGSACS